jgi:large subunit ribosomal protein L15
MLKLHSLKPTKNSKKSHKRVGRGQGSGRGKTAGRGTKGQKARTGGRNKLRLKGMKFVTARLPKLRGFTSRYRKDEVVTLSEITRVFTQGGIVSPSTLAKKGLVSGPLAKVKIVGNDEITARLTVKRCKISAGAKAAVLKAGGVA